MTTLPTRQQTSHLAGPQAGVAMRRPPMAGGPSGGQNAGMTGKDVMRILQKHVWLIVILLIVFVVLAGVITYFWMKHAPTYTAAAAVRVNLRSQHITEIESRATNANELEILKNTYVQEATRKSVLTRAIEEDRDLSSNDLLDRIKKTRYYAKSPDDVIDRLQKQLKVSSVRDAYHIIIKLSGSNKRELPEIVNAVAVAWVRQTAEDAQTAYSGNVGKIDEEVRSIRKRIDSLHKEIDEQRSTAHDPVVADQNGISQQELRQLAKEKLERETELRQAEIEFGPIAEKNQKGELLTDPMVLMGVGDDRMVSLLRQNRDSLRIEIKTQKELYGSNHRKVNEMASRLAEVEKELAVAEKQAAESLAAGLLDQVKNRVTKARQDLEATRQKYNEASSAARDQGILVAKISKKLREIKSLEMRAQTLESALSEIRLGMRSVRPLELSSLADEPKTPSMPKYTITIPLGAFLGLAIGLGLAFLMELVDTSVKGPSDITRRVDVPILGMIPHEDDLEEEVEDMRTTLLALPDSLVGEAFRQVRTTLLFSGPASQRRSLMVTSPSPGDGRTTVAVNLAASIAHGGRKVLIVDANFRQPVVHKLFPGTPVSGLSSALVGQASWKEQVHEVEANLSVMAAGPLPPNPSELLGSEQMRTMLGEMTAEYDQVIFDTAPALVVSDPAVLSTIVDGVIVTVRAGVNTYGVVQRTKSVLTGVGANIVGAVLNGMRVTAGGYLRKNYDQFYEYRERQDLPEPEPVNV